MLQEVFVKVWRAAGLPATLEAIGALRRDPRRYLGFVEVQLDDAGLAAASALGNSSANTPRSPAVPAVTRMQRLRGATPGMRTELASGE